MPDDITASTVPDDRFERVLAELLQAEERGEPLDLTRVVRAAPELETPLRDFFRDRDGFDRLAPCLAPKTPTDPPPDLSTGGRFGGYEILGALGRGGMGIVYHARQLSPQREVALKVIRTDRLAELTPEEARQWVERFRREAQVVASLEQHPNLVTLYEVGEHDGRPFFSMERVGGGSLVGRIRRNPEVGGPDPAGTLSPRAAAALLETVARAMQHAHDRGILHRDLKPANVLLDALGRPKVTDFGLALWIASDQRQTQSGAILGSPSYLAPEQARGQKTLTSATDVYGLGAILYELLTGRPPFEGKTTFDTLLMVLNQEPVPPRAYRPGLSRDLETICLKCLRKEPRQRYRSAEALAEDLHRFQAGKPIEARPIPLWERTAKWVKRQPAFAALLAISFVAVLSLGSLGAHSYRAYRQVKVQQQQDIERAWTDLQLMLANIKQKYTRSVTFQPYDPPRIGSGPSLGIGGWGYDPLERIGKRRFGGYNFSNPLGVYDPPDPFRGQSAFSPWPQVMLPPGKAGLGPGHQFGNRSGLPLGASPWQFENTWDRQAAWGNREPQSPESAGKARATSVVTVQINEGYKEEVVKSVEEVIDSLPPNSRKQFWERYLQTDGPDFRSIRESPSYQEVDKNYFQPIRQLPSYKQLDAKYSNRH